MVADVPPSVPFAIFAVKILTELGDLTLVQPSGPVMVPESRTARCSNSRSPTTDAGRSTLKLVALEGNDCPVTDSTTVNDGTAHRCWLIRKIIAASSRRVLGADPRPLQDGGFGTGAVAVAGDLVLAAQASVAHHRLLRGCDVDFFSLVNLN